MTCCSTGSVATARSAGHALGNLLITALWDLHHDPVVGLDLVGRLLNARGRVLPMAAVPLEITARVQGLDAGDPEALSRPLRGQVAVATTKGTVVSIALEPAGPALGPRDRSPPCARRTG